MSRWTNAGVGSGSGRCGVRDEESRSGKPLRNRNRNRTRTIAIQTRRIRQDIQSLMSRLCGSESRRESCSLTKQLDNNRRRTMALSCFLYRGTRCRHTAQARNHRQRAEDKAAQSGGMAFKLRSTMRDGGREHDVYTFFLQAQRIVHLVKKC